MAFGNITVTESTFGSISGSVVGAIPGTLSGSVGVPGPQGPAGSQGPQGPAGEGVPAGGTAGMVLAKVDGVDYNTEWVNVDVSGYRSLTDFDFTNVAATSLTTFGLTLEPVVASAGWDSQLSKDLLRFEYDSSADGTVAGVLTRSNLGLTSFDIYREQWTEVDGSIVSDGGAGSYFNKDGFFFRTLADVPAPSTMQYGRTSITFPNASVQTIAFPGFNNVALTGNSTAVTAALGDNDTSIATTAFVQQELASGTAVARNLEVQVRNQSGSTVPAGSIVYISGATGNLPLITLAQANNDANSAQTIGFVKTSIANNGTGYVIVRGVLDAIDTSALTEGVQLYLSPTTAGAWTTSKPSAPQHLVYVGIVIRSHPTLGTILVSVQNGYELHELHDVAIASEANNDLLVYELSTDLWKNKSFATLGLATLNSPVFSGTPSLPTGTTAVTQSPGNNTTALATTAFVTASNPDASTTVKGHVELATNAEAVAGTSATLAMTPASNYWADKKSGHSFVQFNSMSATTSGTGASAGLSLGGYFASSPTTAIGHAIGSFTFASAQRGINRLNGSWNWSKAFTASFRYTRNVLATDTNTITRVTFGKAAVSPGDPTIQSVGIKMAGNTALQLIVHNGTTFTAVTTTSSILPSVPLGVDMRITSDGAGNVSLFVNDVLEATTSAGPTSASGTASANLVMMEAQNAAIITGSNSAFSIYNLHMEFAD